MNLQSLKLCLVTHFENQTFQTYKELILQAIEGGITSIQLRKKTADLIEFKQLAIQFKQLLQPFAIPLIINDYVKIAKEVDADGVHIGQTDMSPTMARKILGPEKFIGLTIETIEQLEIANQLSCINYVAVSSVFPSHTKLDCKTVLGIDGLKKFSKLSRHPFIAIGGINKINIAEIIKCNVLGVAVVSAIHTNNPKEAAAELMAEINRNSYKIQE